MLAGKDETAMAQRPPSGRWSVNENLRHLLFAEQLHLGGLLAGERTWSPLGFTPAAMQVQRKLPEVAADTIPSVADILAAWDEVHAAVAGELAGNESELVHAALTRNLKHLRSHINVIGRLLSPKRANEPATRVRSADAATAGDLARLRLRGWTKDDPSRRPGSRK